MASSKYNNKAPKGAVRLVGDMYSALAASDAKIQELIQTPIDKDIKGAVSARRAAIQKEFKNVRAITQQGLAASVTGTIQSVNPDKDSTPSKKALQERALPYRVMHKQIVREANSAEKHALALVSKLNYTDSKTERGLRGQIRRKFDATIATGNRIRLVRARGKNWSMPSRFSRLVEVASKQVQTRAMQQKLRGDGYKYVEVYHPGGISTPDTCTPHEHKIYPVGCSPALLPPYHIGCSGQIRGSKKAS
jgi:hypothetical protein